MQRLRCSLLLLKAKETVSDIVYTLFEVGARDTRPGQFAEIVAQSVTEYLYWTVALIGFLNVTNVELVHPRIGRLQPA